MGKTYGKVLKASLRQTEGSLYGTDINADRNKARLIQGEVRV